jgi:hypothetical protein
MREWAARSALVNRRPSSVILGALRMSEKLRVSFESPQSGWMSLRLEADGRKFVTAVAHRPYDSLRELIEVLIALLEGRDRDAVVRWNREPDEFDFEFVAREAEVSVEVAHYPDHRRRAREVVFRTRQQRADVCLAFWRELRQLRRRTETDEFEQNWRRAFPEEELRRFTKTLRAHRRRREDDATPSRESA